MQASVRLVSLLVPEKGLFGGSIGQEWMLEFGAAETHVTWLLGQDILLICLLML